MKNAKPFLKHIIEECELIISSLKEKKFEDFINDEILKRAIVRSLEVIGEAAKNVPHSFKDRHEQIPWRKISGLRDILIHKYFGVDYRNVWKIAKEDVPKLREEIAKLIEEDMP